MPEPLPNRADLVVSKLVQRFGTNAGVGVKAPVTAAGTSASITFKRPEYDALYGVTATTNWLTTIAVTSRSSVGFTLSFGTAAPSGATVDWCLFRSED